MEEVQEGRPLREGEVMGGEGGTRAGQGWGRRRAEVVETE